MSVTSRLAVLAVLVLGCREARVNQAELSQKPVEVQPDTSVESVSPHAPRRARWRIDPSCLNNVAFALERILISHRDVRPTPVGAFNPDAPKPRSREEAWQLAVWVAQEARQNPGRFHELAQQYSDDSVTAPWGGKLGVVRATMIEQEVVDALDQLPVDEVSEAFDTAAGFQIVRRRSPPPEEWVSAEAIVIKHRHAEGWIRGGRVVTRDRAQARQLAEELAASVAQPLVDFSKAVDEYSDDISGANGGDLGVKSTHSADHDALLLQVLAELRENETSKVVETARGFFVLRRTRATQRELLASSEIVLGHDLSQVQFGNAQTGPAPTRSRAQAFTLARELTEKLQANPGMFEAMQRQYCDLWTCRRPPTTWRRGRRLWMLERALSRVHVGEVIEAPVETPLGFHILRREDPEQFPEPSPDKLTFEVPRPPLRDYAYFLATSPGSMIASITRDQSRDFLVASRASEERAQRMMSAVDHFAAALLTAIPSERGSLYGELKAKLVDVLGADGTQKYEQFANQRLEQIQLGLQGAD